MLASGALLTIAQVIADAGRQRSVEIAIDNLAKLCQVETREEMIAFLEDLRETNFLRFAFGLLPDDAGVVHESVRIVLAKKHGAVPGLRRTSRRGGERS